MSFSIFYMTLGASHHKGQGSHGESRVTWAQQQDLWSVFFSEAPCSLVSTFMWKWSSEGTLEYSLRHLCLVWYVRTTLYRLIQIGFYSFRLRSMGYGLCKSSFYLPLSHNPFLLTHPSLSSTDLAIYCLSVTSISTDMTKLSFDSIHNVYVHQQHTLCTELNKPFLVALVLRIPRLPGVCRCYGKGHHWTNACSPRRDIQGDLLPLGSNFGAQAHGRSYFRREHLKVTRLLKKEQREYGMIRL